MTEPDAPSPEPDAAEPDAPHESDESDAPTTEPDAPESDAAAQPAAPESAALTTAAPVLRQRVLPVVDEQDDENVLAERLRDETLRVARKALRSVRTSRFEPVRRSYVLGRTMARRTVNTVTSRQLGWMAHLRGVRWDGPVLEIWGWCYERGFGYPDADPQIRIWLQSPATSTHLDFDVTITPDVDVNAAARGAEHDYGNTSFVARLDTSELLRHVDDEASAEEGWRAMLSVSGAGHERTGWFKYRKASGSARFLTAHTHPGDIQVYAAWTPEAGLTLHCHRAAVMATDVTASGRTVEAILHSTGPVPVAASLEHGPLLLPARLAPLRGKRWRLTAEVPFDFSQWRDIGDPEDEDELAATGVVSATIDPGEIDTFAYVLKVTDRFGEKLRVRTDLDNADPIAPEGSTLLVHSGPRGQLMVRDAPAVMVVDDVQVELGPVLGVRLHGIHRGAVGARPELAFRGNRQTLPVDVELRPDGTWEGFAPLLASMWDQPPQTPMLGTYILRGSRPDGQRFRISCTPHLIERTPEKVAGVEGFRLRLETGAERRVVLRVGAPRRDDELGSFHQQRLEEEHRELVPAPEDAVYFESFYGRKATCNPHAVDHEIATRHPELARYWGVTDNSVPVPEGAVPVVEGTLEWWRVRSAARYVVVNDWLRRRFEPKDFQVVLQTWHGSMFKRIGLDRTNTTSAIRKALRSEKAKWDILLSQNRHSTDILRTAYEWDRTFFEEGYPRNDPMATEAGAALGVRVRERLGIRPEQTVVLYAPTWRDSQTEMVTFLDLGSLAADLGGDYVVLLRGHSRTQDFGENVETRGVIDVTTYPHVTDLFLASDILVTDYSSVMFDFSVTGRPMIFFVPDIEDYRDSIRGVYFDLSDLGPGPVVMTQDEVVESIRSAPTDREAYAARYRAWQERFNHLDDGHSAERIVARLLSFQKAPRQEPARRWRRHS